MSVLGLLPREEGDAGILYFQETVGCGQGPGPRRSEHRLQGRHRIETKGHGFGIFNRPLSRSKDVAEQKVAGLCGGKIGSEIIIEEIGIDPPVGVFIYCQRLE